MGFDVVVYEGDDEDDEDGDEEGDERGGRLEMEVVIHEDEKEESK
jgi:hypothetical protein